MIRYAITDRALFGADQRMQRAGLLRQMGELAKARVGFVQLREKDLEPARLMDLAREAMEQLEQGAAGPGRRPSLLVSGRADVAVAARADGVHLTSAPGEMRPAQVRRVYALAGLGRPVVSVSCHSVEQVQRVTADGEPPDLILFGPVFEKVVRVAGHSTGAGEPVNANVAEGSGLELLGRCCAEAAPVPVLALGGVTLENMHHCVAAGAAGVAAIRLFAEFRRLDKLTGVPGPG